MRLRLRPTKKVLIGLGALALASVVLAFFTWRVQSEVRAKKRAALKAKQEEMQQILEEAKSLEESRARKEAILYRMSFLRESEPDDYQASLLVEFSGLAKACGVKLATFNLTEPAGDQKSPVAKMVEKKLAPHTFQTITGGMEGSYHNVARFLYRLTGLSKIVSVDSLQVQPSQGERVAPDQVRVSFQMTAYAIKAIQPQTLMAVAKLKEIAKAEEEYQKSKQTYADLDTLHASDPNVPKENTVIEGYTFKTDKSATGKGGFKILATTTTAGLPNLSINQTKTVTNETDKKPFE